MRTMQHVGGEVALAMVLDIYKKYEWQHEIKANMALKDMSHSSLADNNESRNSDTDKIEIVQNNYDKVAVDSEEEKNHKRRDDEGD